MAKFTKQSVLQDIRVEKASAWLLRVMLLAISVALAQEWGAVFLQQVNATLGRMGMATPSRSITSLVLTTAIAFQFAHLMDVDLGNVIAGASFSFN